MKKVDNDEVKNVIDNLHNVINRAGCGSATPEEYLILPEIAQIVMNYYAPPSLLASSPVKKQ